jgi:hypothetical protein
MAQEQLNPAVKISESVSEGRHLFNLPVIVPWLLSVVTALIGIWQFAEQQDQKNKEQFLLKQLETTFQASDTAAILATETNPTEWEKARSKFWKLYWGTLSIVEDSDVEAAMVHLGSQVPQEPVSQPALPMKVLERPSLCLAHKVRNLLLRSWKVHLSPLESQVTRDPCQVEPKRAS